MDDTDEFGYLYADLDEHVNAGLTRVNSSSDSTAKELMKSNDCEFNNRSDSSVDEADAVLDLGDGIQSDDYSSDSEDDLCIVLNEIERSDSRQLEVEGKEEDFGIGNGLAQHEKCEPIGYGKGDWGHFSYFGGLNNAVENGFNFFLPRNWTIFDVNIEELDYKPWRRGGANISDFFNFDLDEDSWKNYCQDLDLLRDKAVMSNWERHDRTAFTVKKISNDPEKLKGRAIPVKSGFGERIPSSDIWRPPPERDSDVVIHINMIGSMEDENNVDKIDVRIPERELESTLMENDIEPTERYFDLEEDDSYCGQDTDPMSYSYNEEEETKSRTATVDFNSHSEESVEECNLNIVHLSIEQKAEFQSSRCPSSRFGADKKSKILKTRKDRDDKNKSSIEECHDICTSDSDGYRGSWGTKKHMSDSRSSPMKERRDQLFVRQVAEPGACWHEIEDRPPIGIRRYRYMDVQNPRNPRSQITRKYGRSTENVKYNSGGYTGHLQMERDHFNQTTRCRENILSQRGHYKQNLDVDHLQTEDEFALGILKERCDERRYNRPINRRFNNFHKGFVKRGYCYDGFPRNVATNKPFMNGRRWYNIDWLDEGNSRMCNLIDRGERNYIADDYKGRGYDLLPLRHKRAVNRFVDVRKKLWRKDYEISGEERSQRDKWSTHCSSDGQDQNHKVSRFEGSIHKRAGFTNNILRVHRYDDSEEVLGTEKIGQREQRFSERILEAMDKMQKRGERFKELAFMKKEGEENEKMSLREGGTDSVADECKPLRPVRKRKWGCQ